VTHPGLCPIAQETASAAPMLCTKYGLDGWMFVGPAVVHSLPKGGASTFGQYRKENFKF